MKKKITVFIALIVSLTIFIGNTKIYADPETLTDNLTYEVKDGILIIGGHGDFTNAEVTAINDLSLTFTGIEFRGDSSKINLKPSSEMFSRASLSDPLESFTIDRRSNVNFNGCTTLEEFFAGQDELSDIDLSGFDTSHVTNMNSMFNGCTSIEEFHLSGFNVSNVTDMNEMFLGTSASIIELRGWNFSNVSNTHYLLDSIDSSYKADILDLSNAILTNSDTVFAGAITNSIAFANKTIIPKSISSVISSEELLDTYYCYDRNGKYLNKKVNHLVATSDSNYSNVYYISKEVPDEERKLLSITTNKDSSGITTPKNISITKNDLVVTAHYDNGTSKDVTSFTMTTMTRGENTAYLIIEYTEGNVTTSKYVNVTYTESKPMLTKIEATKTQLEYTTNASVDINNMSDITVTAFYDNNTSKPVTTFTKTLSKNVITISYKDPDTNITKTTTITLSINDLILDITAYKDEEDYEYASDVELDDITVYLNYANGTRIKLNKKDSEHPDGYTVTYDPDDDEEEIVIKYKKDGVTYTDYIQLDIDEFDDDDDDNRYLKKIVATKDKTEYYSDEKVEYDDIKVKAYYYTSKKDDYLDEDDYKVSINSSKTKITVKYTYKGETCTDTITLKRKSGTSTNNTYVTYPKKTLRLYIGTTTAYVNDIYNGLDVAPEVKNDRTYLPIRFVAEALGAKVYWYASNPKEVIIVSTTGNRITLHIGEAVAQVNNYQVPLEDAPYIKNDRTYLPVRFVSEQLGATVNWNALNPNEITIIQNY